MRTLDRLRLDRVIDERALASLREAALRIIARDEVVEVTRTVLAAPANRRPRRRGPLDAIHLASLQL